jgi:hypothetical protein
MKELFKDILNMEGVKGVLLLSLQGDIVFKEFLTPLHQKLESRDWKHFVGSLNGVRETDLVYENARIYIRKTGSGYLLILMDFFVSAAMVRLSCDILLPALKQMKGSKGFKRLFKK